MSHPLSAKRTRRLTEAVVARDCGRCQRCGLDCLDFGARLVEWQQSKHYDEIREILREHDLPAPKVGQKCFHIDHVVPIARGGQTCLENLRVLCLPCHRQVTRDLRQQLRVTPRKVLDQEISQGYLTRRKEG